GAASPASAALIRRRRDGDPATLRVCLILVLPGRRRLCARCYRNFAILRQPGLAQSHERVAAATCRLLSSLRESRIAPRAVVAGRVGVAVDRCEGLDSLWLHSSSVDHCKEQSKNNERGRTSSRRFLSTTLGRSLGCGFRALRSYACMRVAPRDPC